MKNKIGDLRDHLFATIEALRDPVSPMEIQRARAIADVAGVIIESAKVEAAMLRVLDEIGAPNLGSTGFISAQIQVDTLPDADQVAASDAPQTRILEPSPLHPWRKRWGRPTGG